MLLTSRVLLRGAVGGARRGPVPCFLQPGERWLGRGPAQVAIALSGAEVNYFELDAMGQLAEMEKKEMECEVAAMDVGPVPPARQRSRFLAVGSVDSTIRLLSLDPADTMKVPLNLAKSPLLRQLSDRDV